MTFSLARRVFAFGIVSIGSLSFANTIVNDFEPADGFTPGPAVLQAPWEIVQGTVSITDVNPSQSAQALVLDPTSPRTVVRVAVPGTTQGLVGFVDFFVRPAATNLTISTLSIATDMADLRIQKMDAAAVVLYRSGNGQGGGEWKSVPTGITLTDLSPWLSGESSQWIRLTLRENYASGSWDLYLNSQLCAANIPATQASATDRTVITITGIETYGVGMDGFYAGPDNPLFADADRDGLNDTWETTVGFDPLRDDRNADANSDGRPNIEQALPDTDQDGLPDGWELRQVGSLVYGPAADPTGVGRTLLQSYRQQLPIWPTATVPEGLRAWYRADHGITLLPNIRTTTWLDISGTGNHLIAHAPGDYGPPEWIADAFNGKPGIDFANSRASALTTTLPVDLNGASDDFTVIMAVAGTGAISLGETLLDHESEKTAGLRVMGWGENTVGLTWRPEGFAIYWGRAVTMTPGLLHVITVVKEGTTMWTYSDGLLQAVMTVPAGVEQLPVRFTVGNRALGFYPFPGRLAETRFYNRALTVTEREAIEAQMDDQYRAPDTDGDGMSDVWELTWAGNLTRLQNPQADSNLDGTTDILHAIRGTNPFAGDRNFGFEQGLLHWTATGTGGNVYAGGTEGVKHYQTGPDSATNTLTSLPFTLSAGVNLFSAQLGKGVDSGLYVALINASTGAEIARLQKSTSLTWQVYTARVIVPAGTVAYVRIVDTATGSGDGMWVDDIRVIPLGNGFSNWSFEDGWNGWHATGTGNQIEGFVSDGKFLMDGVKAYQTGIGAGVLSAAERARTNEIHSDVFTLTAGQKLFSGALLGPNELYLSVALYSAVTGAELCRLSRHDSGPTWASCYTAFQLASDTPVFIRVADYSSTAHVAVDRLAIQDYTFGNFGFEQNLEGWTATGTGGNVYAGGMEGAKHYQTGPDSATNTLTSLPFTVSAGINFFSAQLGKGNHAGLYIALYNATTGAEIARLKRNNASGHTWELRSISFTLPSPTPVYLKIADSYTGSWGGLWVDDIRIVPQ